MDSLHDQHLLRIDSWSVRDGQSRHTLDVSLFDVTLEEVGPSPLMGGGLTCTYEEFLQGKIDDAVGRIIGDGVLQEAYALVRHNTSLRRTRAD